MPHSSGGGSRSSGSFSGSSSSFGRSSYSRGSSSSSTSRGPKVSNEYRSGYHRYVYYRNSRPVYFYSSEPIRKKDTRLNVGLLLFWLLLIAIGLFLTWVFISDWIHIPQKLDLNYWDTDIHIIDQAEILTDAETEELQRSFIRFQEETGITPAILTVRKSEWANHYSDFSHFAYESYLNLFSDESHWLFCYSTDDTSDFDDWQWEGMQGDNTDKVLTEKKTDAFTESVQKYLYARTRYSVGEAFNLALQDLQPTMMKTTFEPVLDDTLYILIYFVALVLYPAYKIVSSVKTTRELKGKEEAVKCPTDQGSVKEDICAYCGGVYVHGVHLKCPHCSAPITPETN